MSLLNKLVAFWSFEESSGNRVDAAGRGNDLVPTAISGGVAPTRVAGKVNYAVHLNCPTDYYLALASNDDVDISDGRSLTVGGQFRVTSYIGGGAPLLVKGPDYGLQFVSASGGNPARIRFYVGAAADTGTGVWAPCDAIVDGAWHYCRGWYDADLQTINVQVDCGTIYSSAFATNPPTDNGNELQIGRERTFDYGVFDADALGIWRRVLDTNEADLLCPGLQYPFGLCGTIKYGDFEFANTFYPAEDGLEWSPSVTPLARDHGGRAIDFFAKPRRLLVKGGEIQGPLDRSDLRTRIDAIKTGLIAQPQDLMFEPDRYWRSVRVEYFRNPYGPTHYCRIAADMEISFLARDPLQYALLPSTDTWTGPTNAATHALPNIGGNIFARPSSIAFLVGGAGAQTINWTLENTTTGKAFTLAGDVTGGQTIIVNCLDMTVKIGTTDEIALFDGEFLTLAVGANSYTVTITTGSITSITTTWRNRYL